jgi:hypothetical protein
MRSIMQQLQTLVQQDQQNQPVASRPIEAIEPAGEAIHESDSLAALREDSKAALAEIDCAERAAISRNAERYGRRLRDLDGRLELWYRQHWDELDLLYQQTIAAAGEERAASRRRWLAHYQPASRLNCQVNQCRVKWRAADERVRQRCRTDRNAVLRGLREAENQAAEAAQRHHLDAIRRDAIAAREREEGDRKVRQAAAKAALQIEAERRGAERAERGATRLAAWPTKANRFPLVASAT